jgi:hypothetical protein
MYVQDNLTDVNSRQLNILKNADRMLVLNFWFILIVFVYLRLIFFRWCAGRIFGRLRIIHLRIDHARIQMSVLVRYSPWPERLWLWCQSLWFRSPQRHVVCGWCCSDITLLVVMRACVLLALQRYHADFSFPYDLVAHTTWHRFLRTQNWNVSGVRVRSSTLLLIRDDAFLSLIRITPMSGSCDRF